MSVSSARLNSVERKCGYGSGTGWLEGERTIGRRSFLPGVKNLAGEKRILAFYDIYDD